MIDVLVLAANIFFLVVSITVLFYILHQPGKNNIRLLMVVAGVGIIILKFGKDIAWAIIGITLVYSSLIKHRNGHKRKINHSD
jgi:hypothetical protein